MRTKVAVGLLAVVVLVGVGYGLNRARSGTKATPSPKAPEAPPAPSKAPEALPASPSPLYVATPWARLHDEPRPDSEGWDFVPVGSRIDFDNRG